MKKVVLFTYTYMCSCSVMFHQAPLSMEFSRQEYWSELPCPPPGDLPDPGIKLESLVSPALAGGFFTTSATWEFKVIIFLWNLYFAVNS